MSKFCQKLLFIHTLKLWSKAGGQYTPGEGHSFRLTVAFFDWNMALESQIMTKCRPRTKIVARLWSRKRRFKITKFEEIFVRWIITVRRAYKLKSVNSLQNCPKIPRLIRGYMVFNLQIYLQTCFQSLFKYLILFRRDNLIFFKFCLVWLA
jgi:hypothetical protein